MFGRENEAYDVTATVTNQLPAVLISSGLFIWPTIQIATAFNQTAIVFRYSAHIKARKTIKTIKTENITHKHSMTVIVSS